VVTSEGFPQGFFSKTSASVAMCRVH